MLAFPLPLSVVGSMHTSCGVAPAVPVAAMLRRGSTTTTSAHGMVGVTGPFKRVTAIDLCDEVTRPPHQEHVILTITQSLGELFQHHFGHLFQHHFGHLHCAMGFTFVFNLHFGAQVAEYSNGSVSDVSLQTSPGRLRLERS